MPIKEVVSQSYESNKPKGLNLEECAYHVAKITPLVQKVAVYIDTVRLRKVL